MIKDKNIKFLVVGVLFLIIFSSAHTYKSIQENKDIRSVILVQESKSITSLIKSFRKTYLNIFINDHIPITKKTINLLPVKTMNDISYQFSKALNAKVILRTVSDRPRNKSNKANNKEMKIIEEFKKTSSKESIFIEEDNNIYRYYEPLYIKKACLKCHGKKEDAPKLIQDRYSDAYNYKLNDLRGIISLEIDKSILINKLNTKDNHNVLYIILNMLILISTIIFLYLKLKSSYKKSNELLVKKNNYLQRKSQEFDDLQNALGVSEIISKSNKDGIITYVNDKFCEVSGYSREELIGSSHNIIRHPDSKDKIFKKMWNTIKNKEVFKTVIKNKRKDGSSYHVDSTIVPILNENGEIKEYLALRHYVEDMMNHKILLKEIINAADNSVLIMVKLDGFDELEDFYTAEIITKLEERFLKKSLTYFPDNCKFNKAYRLENGEFAFIKETDDYQTSVEDRGKSIKEFQNNIKLAKYIIDGYEFNPSVIVSFSTGKDDIYENTKLGLKKLIKENKKFINANGLAKESRQRAQKNINTIKMIKDAIDSQNIISHYQPLYNNKTKKIEKYESLVRLIDNSQKIISPFFFLDTAKKANYYNQITKIVFSNSLKVLRKMEEDISINLSFLDIENDETREYIYNALNHCEQCHRIVIELLEDETTKDFKVIQEFIQKVKTKGIKIAIDDFGAGYSNFERLLDFQPDILKIDGSLIKNIASDKYSRNIAETIVEFARKENIKTVAEFVHNQEVFDIVNEIGIDYTQGYYISEPKPL